MRTVFPDTVGLIATWDERDQWHHAAEPVFQTLVRQGATLVTTEFVLAECGNAAARKPYRSRVSALRNSLLTQDRIIELSVFDLTLAWQEFGKLKAEAPGIVDLLSFRAMQKVSALEVFTNDQHFRAAGFVTLF